jgi:nicotinamidase-related amidase
MARPEGDLYGNAPDKAQAALLLIDVINDLEFPEGDQLLEHMLPMAKRLARLKQQARQAGIPTVYVNDNFGRWRSDFRALIDHCLHDDVRGREVVKLLHPDSRDYFVLKPKQSGFTSTALELLLDHFSAQTLILTGVAGNMCVLFTAVDAYQHGYRILVPSDCVASNTAEDNRQALELMQTAVRAEIGESETIDLRGLGHVAEHAY